MGKKGSISHFSRALPACIWGHCSQALVFISIWGTQKGLFFPSIWVAQDPPKLQIKGEPQMTNRPCFTPSLGYLLLRYKYITQIYRNPVGLCNVMGYIMNMFLRKLLVAQCSATRDIVAATPPVPRHSFMIYPVQS